MKKSKYQEGNDSTFTHWGIEYHLNTILTIAERIPAERVKMTDLLWNIKDESDLDNGRLSKVDVEVPLIGIREGNTIFILDGNHRLYKLHNLKKKDVLVKFITKEHLESANMEKFLKNRW